jgi:Flp pilus assembly protein protease CpaA
MIALIVFLACVFVAVAAGAMAAWSDWKGMTIPNLYSALIIGAFFPAFIFVKWLGPSAVFFSLTSHLLAALIVFGVTAVMFAVKAIGAADSKLGTAFAFWVGLKGLPAFLFYMALAGGLLGLTALALRKWKPVKNPPAGSWIARVQAGEGSVPYGIAISLGALASFLYLGYLGVDVLYAFALS